MRVVVVNSVRRRKLTRACAKPGEEGGERRGAWGRLGASAKLLWYEVCVLHRHPVFLANIWAYVPVQAVLGALTFWGPKARLRLVAGSPLLSTCRGHGLALALWSTSGWGPNLPVRLRCGVAYCVQVSFASD